MTRAENKQTVEALARTTFQLADELQAALDDPKRYEWGEGPWEHLGDAEKDVRLLLAGIAALRDLVAQADRAAELEAALRQIRDTAKWYGEGPRLEHEVHHALVVEVYSVADLREPLRELAGYVRAHLAGQNADPELRWALEQADEALAGDGGGA